MTLKLHHDAEVSFAEAQIATQEAAKPVLELLSSGFQITWFRETAQNLWQALIKPNSDLMTHFGLRQECLVIGNGYPNDFHQRTLRQDLPKDVRDRIDTTIRFVASEAPIATAFCAAWAQKNSSTIVLIRMANLSGADRTEQLYALLSGSLWRRDFFAESEPVRDPTEFFGRELIVNELLTKVLVGAPFALFGLRKIGKTSLLARLEDLLEQDRDSVTATAFLVANTTRLKSGRWWHVAQDMLMGWQTKLQRIAKDENSKIVVKAERLNELISKKSSDESMLATAFERDIAALLKGARALRNELNRDAVRLVLFVDECDHLYPHLPKSGYWRTDFFPLWSTLQAIKRRLDSPDELVFVLSGVNPSGVERGSLEGQPNPLYELQRSYLSPMPKGEADALLNGLGGRTGLDFDEGAFEKAYDIVGGHPLLLRKLGSAIHESLPNRSARRTVTRADVDTAFRKHKRDFFNQVSWILEHLSTVAPDEERLLRDIATGGARAYAEIWKDDDFRETYAHHLERYGLVKFQRELPEVAFPLIKDALREPVASVYIEQKRQLKDAVDSIEAAVRYRIRSDMERDRDATEAVARVVNAIPSDAKTRALDREDLLSLGEFAGLSGVLDSMNWGDYQIIFDKFHDEFQWVGVSMTKPQRLTMLKATFEEVHIVRHNNDNAIQASIEKKGFRDLFGQFAEVREMLSA